MRKIISILAALMSLLPISVSAQIVNQPVDYDFEVDNVYYRVIPRTNTLEVCGLAAETEDVVIPENIPVSVGDSKPVLFTVVGVSPGAFSSRSDLKSVKLPDTLPGIEEAMFFKCTNLKNVELGHSIKYIKKNAFYDTYIEVLTIPATDDDIEYHPGAFAVMNKLKKLIIEDCDKRLFYDPPKKPLQSLRDLDPTSIVLPNLEEIYVGRKLSFINFAKCPNVTKLRVGKYGRIGEHFMEGCKKLTTVVQTGGGLGRKAFKDCTSLEKVILGFCSFVYYLDDFYPYDLYSDWVFEGCCSLKYIECSAVSPPTTGRGLEDGFGYHIFDGVRVNTCQLVVPIESVDKYRNSPIWGVFNNIKGKDFSAVGIEEVAEDDVISIEGGSLISAKDSVSVSVYSVDGCQVASRVLSQGESIELPARGIYIVVADGKSRKIAY